MVSYHVFFTPKPEIGDDTIVAAAHRFFGALKEEGKIAGYRLIRVTNPASFQGIPRFQAIVDYASRQGLDDSFAFMRQPERLTSGAHGELMHGVAEFKVTFTTDV